MNKLDEILSELSNTIPEFQKEEYEYEVLPDDKYTWALVKIKNITIKANPKFKDSVDRPGYQLSFRERDHKSAFMNIRFAAATGARATMMKHLGTMSEGKIKPNCPKEEAFNFLKGSIGKWFTFSIEQKPWQDKIFMNLVGSIKPANGVTLDPWKHFEADAPHAKDMPTGFEAMPKAGSIPTTPPEDDELPWNDNI